MWFFVGLMVGGVLGMMLLALMMAAKEADEHLEKEDAPVECFWCDGRMVRLPDGQSVCSNCGWRYEEVRR